MISGIDIILLVSLIAFTVHGFSKGLVSKLLSLAAILGGIIIAAKYSKKIALWVQGIIGGSEMVCGIIGIVLLFAILLLVSSILTKMFRKVSIFRVWDKFGGAIFGLLEGALMISLLLLFLSIFDIPAAGSSRDKSCIYMPLRNFAVVVYTTFVAKESTEKTIDDFFSKGSVEQPPTK
ncbi:MAG TPA: CvpA family protein [Candidatus Acidoferrales bacterium]|nr:CvpA family protein [Candidatus Acidoferrales bacterium]